MDAQHLSIGYVLSVLVFMRDSLLQLFGGYEIAAELSF